MSSPSEADFNAMNVRVKAVLDKYCDMLTAAATETPQNLGAVIGAVMGGIAGECLRIGWDARDAK